MAAISIKTESQHIALQTGMGQYMCENSRDRFLPVNFSHVDAISGDLSAPIRLLAILRGDRNEFSHSLGQDRS
jgi:hypothetical protein